MWSESHPAAVAAPDGVGQRRAHSVRLASAARLAARRAHLLVLGAALLGLSAPGIAMAAQTSPSAATRAADDLETQARSLMDP